MAKDTRQSHQAAASWPFDSNLLGPQSVQVPLVSLPRLCRELRNAWLHFLRQNCLQWPSGDCPV